MLPSKLQHTHATDPAVPPKKHVRAAHPLEDAREFDASHGVTLSVRRAEDAGESFARGWRLGPVFHLVGLPPRHQADPALIVVDGTVIGEVVHQDGLPQVFRLLPGEPQPFAHAQGHLAKMADVTAHEAGRVRRSSSWQGGHIV